MGSLAGGAATVSGGTGAFELPVTWAARTERPDGKTSPEELVAAAHASCFAMALAIVLGEDHERFERLTVTAICAFDEVSRTPRITRGELSVQARSPSLDAARFERYQAKAQLLCPVSNALRGNIDITVHGEVEWD